MNASAKTVFQTFMFCLVAIFGLSVGASAQTVFGALEADAGSFSEPIALGEDIQLSACGSMFVTNSAGNFGLCDAPTINQVEFSWFLGNDSTGDVFEFVGSVFTLATGGVGDFINAAGTYSVFLNISALQNPLNLVNGASGRILGNTFDNDFTSFTVTSVPEPETLLLLVPALLMIGRRQRRLIKFRSKEV